MANVRLRDSERADRKEPQYIADSQTQNSLTELQGVEFSGRYNLFLRTGASSCVLPIMPPPSSRVGIRFQSVSRSVESEAVRIHEIECHAGRDILFAIDIPPTYRDQTSCFQRALANALVHKDARPS